MRNRYSIWIMAALLLLAVASATADTFVLNDGQTVTGELIVGSANDSGIQVRIEEGRYERIPWANLSQADLRKLRQEKKLESYVEPFIEVSDEERIRRTQVTLNTPPRLERPAARSLVAALATSSAGILVILLVYGANLYAAYEVALFRGRPMRLVCGVSALAPIIGPIVFLALPVPGKTSTTTEAEETPAAPRPATDQPVSSFELPTAAPGAATPRPSPITPPRPGVPVPLPAPGAGPGLHLAHTEPAKSSSAVPAEQVFQRGAFTFNRRFFETRFPGFFGIVRRDADKDMVLIIKSARGQYTAQRISRIAANDMHIQVHVGNASEEIAIPFSEVQEVRLKHKDVA